MAEAQQLAMNFQEISSTGLLKKVTTRLPYQFGRHEIGCPHIIVYDFGVKQNILQTLNRMGCKITVVPATMPINKVYQLAPDGILLSNGPGDPKAYSQVIDSVKSLVVSNLPIFGICLGHQLLGLALNIPIEKLKFGHHGINHPVKSLQTGQVFISSQNHNFTLSDETFPDDYQVTYRSLFDNSIQGIQHKYKAIFGIQGHPEGCPGPTELDFLFKEFIGAAREYMQQKTIGSNQCLSTLG